MNIIRKIISLLRPPDNWLLPVIITSGIFTGLVFLIFYVGNGVSYLSDNPETCINCHVMFPQYSSWQHSSHTRYANCNDCHVPQNNIFSKYFFKASDGFRHSSIFTLRLEPQVIQIKNAGKNVVQDNCIRCHSETLSLNHSAQSDGGYLLSNDDFCWKCHLETPHGKVNSLSSTPNVKVPELSPIIPKWIEKITRDKE